ncbi:MAG: hypothetical protein EXS16_07675 [Gemmataceae bacterium]|nr:hypothetical protein [Gemmataceae bacterium]
MTTFIRLALTVAIAIGFGPLLHAQDTEKERTKGQVLILKNGNVMEGNIEKVGGQYCLRKGKSEVWIAADKITQLCADWEDAYTYAQKFIKQDSAVDRVRLARWCQLHNLHEKSLLEARIALNLDPSNSDAKQIITYLERELNEPNRPNPAKLAAKQEPIKAPPFVDVTTDTLIGFQSRVQPILFNACVTCHASGHGGKLHLDRASTTRQQAAAQHNLAAIMSYIDFDRPAVSPLLLKAITAHGDAPHAPIKNRDAKPFQAIQQWIEQMIARNPHLKEQRDATRPVVASKTPIGPNATGFATQATATAIGGTTNAGFPRRDDFNIRPSMPKQGDGLRSSSMPLDPYDSTHFNQRFHPKR